MNSEPIERRAAARGGVRRLEGRHSGKGWPERSGLLGEAVGAPTTLVTRDSRSFRQFLRQFQRSPSAFLGAGSREEGRPAPGAATTAAGASGSSSGDGMTPGIVREIKKATTAHLETKHRETESNESAGSADGNTR